MKPITMKRGLRAIGVALFFQILTAVSGHSQAVAADPNDPLYARLDAWIAAGLVDRPFMLRPYSPEVLASMLRNVVSRGSPTERREAAVLLEELETSRIEAGLHHGSKGLVSSDSASSAYFGETGALLELNARLREGLWISGGTGLQLADQADSSAPQDTSLPGERHAEDLVSDDGKLSVQGFNGKDLAFRLSSFSNASYAHGDFWVQAGVTRSSYGPFFGNGVVLGPQAPAAANWSASCRLGAWRYSMLLMNLTKSARSASADGGPDVDVSTDTDKFLMFHSFSYSPLPALDLGLFETVVWANHFEPLYILPFANYFALQSLSGFEDNSLAGVYATLSLPGRLEAKGQVYIDDIGFNDFAQLDFDAKLLAAAEGGLSWAPADSSLRLLGADYTAVLPYMYTHHYSGTAQDDYTQAGACLGAELPPNSDRVEIRARFAFDSLPGLDLEALARLIRHGNASEGLYAGTGGLDDDGWTNGECTYTTPYGSTTSPKYLRFLSQSVLEKTWELGAGASCRLPLGKGGAELSARYVFAYVENAGLVAGRNDMRHYLSFGLTCWL
jgi:hypothetical protein